jgi:hypothetical protein
MCSHYTALDKNAGYFETIRCYTALCDAVMTIFVKRFQKPGNWVYVQKRTQTLGRPEMPRVAKRRNTLSGPGIHLHSPSARQSI